MKQFKWIKTILWLFGIGFLVLSGFTIIYSVYLSSDIKERFSGRRWHIPSKVFSDVLLLFPGQQINRPLFYQKATKTMPKCFRRDVCN